MAARVTVRVEMEDGSDYDVATDQRDFAKWEMQTFFDNRRDVVRTRFLAFAAASRTGMTVLSWPKFDAACVSATSVDGSVETVDPTEPDPSGAP